MVEFSIRALRKEMKLTQSDLAQLFGVTQAHISRSEQFGNRKILLLTMQFYFQSNRIAKLFQRRRLKVLRCVQAFFLFGLFTILLCAIAPVLLPIMIPFYLVILYKVLS